MAFTDENYFGIRLARLRYEKGVSARDMSLSIGQNHAYINTIESGKALPSLEGFFFICEYLGITPSQFFDEGNENPTKLDEVIGDLKKLNSTQLEHISALVKELIKNK